MNLKNFYKENSPNGTVKTSEIKNLTIILEDYKKKNSIMYSKSYPSEVRLQSPIVNYWIMKLLQFFTATEQYASKLIS